MKKTVEKFIAKETKRLAEKYGIDEKLIKDFADAAFLSKVAHERIFKEIGDDNCAEELISLVYKMLLIMEGIQGLEKKFEGTPFSFSDDFEVVLDEEKEEE